MFPGIDDNLRESLFHDAPESDGIWIGEIYILQEDQQELMPVRFGLQDFWVGFTSPHFEVGNDPDSLEIFSEHWSDGFIPKEFSRLVKFARADAVSDHYKPDLWKLDEPQQVYQFSQTIADAVVFHYQTYPRCEQYFFWPASSQLALLYRRAFRYIDRDCLPGQFKRIIDSTGVFNGYQHA